MATIYSNVGGLRIELRVTETGTSVTNNTSTLSWSLVGYQTYNTSWYANNYHAVTVTINGTNVYTRAATTSVLINIGNQMTSSNPFTIASGTTTVAHNSDGTKTAALAFSVQYRWDSTYSWNASGSMSLTTIARASSPTVSSSSVNIGSAVTITTNRASTSFTHTLSYTFGSQTGTIATGVGASYSWTVPSSLASVIPYDTSGTCTITCVTYNGSTQIGTNTVTVTLTVPSSYVPTATLTLEEAGDTPSGWSVYVQGKSKLKITATITNAYGAYITQCVFATNSETLTVYGNSTSYSSTTSYLKYTGSKTVTCTITDSRGRTGTVTASYTTSAYALPTITWNAAYRVASSGSTTRDDTGAYGYVSVTCAITAVGSNSGSGIVYAKKASAYSYTQADTIDSTTSTITKQVWIAMDTSSSYNVKVTFTDAFETVLSTSTVMSESVMINIRNTGQGLGIGKVSEADEMIDSAWGFRTPLDVTAGYGETYQTSLLGGYTTYQQDTSHVWKYRWLASDQIEVLYWEEISTLDLTTAVGNMYTSSDYYDITIPSDLPFTAISNAWCWQVGPTWCWGTIWITPTTWDSSTWVFRHKIFSPTSVSLTNVGIGARFILKVS